LAKKFCLQLKSNNLDEALGLQIVKNLLYLGKCFDSLPAPDHLDVDEDDEDDETSGKPHNPLRWLFSRLSYQIRSAQIARRNRTAHKENWSHQPLSILRWFAAMASYMDVVKLEQFLVHILSPVYRIIEDDTIHDPQMSMCMFYLLLDSFH
jgi:U3 small nucleolar RNA-associated protein 20